MSRPKPIILAEITDKTSYKTEQVLSASAVYAVFYQGNPINIRILNKLIPDSSPKYKKSSFGNQGSAFNLAKKLNHQFKTVDFNVYKLTSGTLLEKNNSLQLKILENERK